ncbi:MAG: hypothetical protein A3F78_22325 [Burkholderiales bacterium RIFCSPLOWO2_12_FULL_61_40]|nr:MAG: hypothetical protein A3F78_22325 [Burkholderiales bacterium RIFCSPLOWO2_12_FULL_61_40]
MKIYYYKHPLGNVGDDLNAWLWPRLLPDSFHGYTYHGAEAAKADDAEPLFIGIGTLLNELVPGRCNKAVFGTGTGYGEPIRHLNAKYYAVRGPLTAMKLGLDPKVAVTDGAALIATLARPSLPTKHKVSIIPHHGSSEETRRWETIAARMGLNFINPSRPPKEVIDAILASELVVTEAMHGAILADTLRVPWIPYLTTTGRHEFKWHDWCASLALSYDPFRLHPLYRKASLRTEFNQFIKQELNCQKLAHAIQRKKPVLSSNVVFESRLRTLQEKLAEFQHDAATGYFEPS